MKNINKIINSPSHVETIKKINELIDFLNKTMGDIMITIHKDVIATEDDLKLINNPEQGDLYFVTETGSAYVYLDSQWKTLAPIIDIKVPTDAQMQLMWQ